MAYRGESLRLLSMETPWGKQSLKRRNVRRGIYDEQQHVEARGRETAWEAVGRGAESRFHYTNLQQAMKSHRVSPCHEH